MRADQRFPLVKFIEFLGRELRYSLVVTRAALAGGGIWSHCRRWGQRGDWLRDGRDEYQKNHSHQVAPAQPCGYYLAPVTCRGFHFPLFRSIPL